MVPGIMPLPLARPCGRHLRCRTNSVNVFPMSSRDLTATSARIGLPSALALVPGGLLLLLRPART